MVLVHVSNVVQPMDEKLTRVLYLSYDGLTDPLGQSQVLPYLDGLAKRGYAITVLSFEKKARLAAEGNAIRTLAQAAGIRWVPLLFTRRPPLLAKFYDRYRMRRTARMLHKKYGFQLVHCRSYVSAEAGLQLKRRYGVKMLFDMRGFWADEKVDTGRWDLSKPLFKRIYGHYKKMERSFLLEADAVVSLTQAAKDYLLNQPVFKEVNIDVIPCCADLTHFDYRHIKPEETNRLRQELKLLPGAKVITYVGSFGGWYMSKEMFAFVRLLIQKHPAYVFLFLTKDDPAAVRREGEAAGLTGEKLIVRSATRNQLPALLALSNCGLFFIRNTFSKMASSPTKHAELMGMGVPVVCNTIGDTGHIIRQTATGQLVETFDVPALQNAVSQLPQTEAIDPAYIRGCALDLFDLTSGVARYHSIYQRLAPAKPLPAKTTVPV